MAKKHSPITNKALKPVVGKPRAPKAKKAAKQAPAKPAGHKSASKLSQIEAAILVLADANEPMHSRAMVDAMQAKGYWTSPGGKASSQTLHAPILRDIRRGKDARFVKSRRRIFALAAR